MTAMPPKVSLITTFFNAEETLKGSLNSSLKQVFEDWEHILVDDGSTDDSNLLAGEFTDERFKLFTPGRLGRAKALNYAVSKAQGDFVAILDADDISHDNRIKKQVTLLDTHSDIDLVYSNARLINDSGTHLGRTKFGDMHEEFIASIMNLNPPAASTVMYRRKVIDSGINYNERCLKSLDFNLYLRCLADGLLTSGDKEELVTVRYTHDSWGKSDNQNLQLRFGILGLVNFYRTSLGQESFFSFPENKWQAFLGCYNQWFNEQPFQDELFVRSIAQRIRTSKNELTWSETLKLSFSLFTRDSFILFNRKSPVSFVFPKSAKEASNYFSRRGY